MQRDIAEKIISKAAEADLIFGNMLFIIEDEQDAKLRFELLDAIYRLIGNMHETVVLPIARRYPDLHPDDPEGFREALRKRGMLPPDQ